jgi:site-specific DNA-methyltransferase (adenine-specific)
VAEGEVRAMTTPYYADDAVTLYHGDCREVTDWLAGDVLVTDPPYGMNHSKHGDNLPAILGESRTGRASDRVVTDEDVVVRNDALRLWGQRPALVFGNWRAPKPIGTRMRMVWDKQTVGMGGVGAWRSADEEIYIVGDWPNPRGSSSDQSSVIRVPALRGEVRPNHPTPKPVSLMEYLITHSPAGIIADPFAGSGSTLVAARAQGRKAIGVELEERYCEVAAKRLDQGVLDFGAVS